MLGVFFFIILGFWICFFSCASFLVAKIALVLICTRFACPVERFGEQEHVEITKWTLQFLHGKKINNCRWSLKSSWKSTWNTLVTSQIEQWKSMCSKCLREEIGCYIVLSQLLQSSHYKMKWYCREGSEKNTWSANYTIKLQNENKSKIKCKHKTRNTANTVGYCCTKM